MTYLAAAPVVPGGNPLIPAWPELVIGFIAFIIVFGALSRVLMPRIQKTLSERTERIEGGIQHADELQKEAQETLERYRAQLNDARREAARLREQAQEQGAQIIAEMREQAQAEARRITEAAQAQLQADRQQAIAALRAEVGAMSVDLASKIIGESLADQARQSRLVDRFLDGLESQTTDAGDGAASGTSGAQATS